jgi:hypothetical protein
MMPFSATGSVTRSAALHESPDTDDELPVSTYTINGEELTYKVAGFKEEANIDNRTLARYALIYDSVVAWNTTEGDWAYWVDGTKTCAEWGDPHPITGVQECERYIYGRVRYMDSCLGELLNYEDTKQQCRKIIDSAVCEEHCWRGGGTDCIATCGAPMPVPWYCGTDYVEINPATHVYRFPFLERLFSFAKGELGDRSMGLQMAETLQEIHTEASVRRTDTPARAQTRDVISMETTNQRRFVTKRMGSTDRSTVEEISDTPVERTINRRWRTPWD